MLRADLARRAGVFFAADALLADTLVVSSWQSHGPLVASEPLHDARVALRHLHSILRTFRSVFPPEWRSSARAEIGWYATLLGDVREMDVIAMSILEPPDRPGRARAVASLTAMVSVDRAGALRLLAAGRDSPRYLRMLHVVGALGTAPLFREGATRDAPRALASKIDRPWRDLRESARATSRPPSEDELHRVRIRAKELRYASELATPALGERAEVLARACARLQRQLGDHRDACFAGSWLRAAADRSPEAAVFARRLALAQDARAELMLARWKKGVRRVGSAHRELRGPKSRSW